MRLQTMMEAKAKQIEADKQVADKKKKKEEAKKSTVSVVAATTKNTIRATQVSMCSV